MRNTFYLHNGWGTFSLKGRFDSHNPPAGRRQQGRHRHHHRGGGCGGANQFHNVKAPLTVLSQKREINGTCNFSSLSKYFFLWVSEKTVVSTHEVTVLQEGSFETFSSEFNKTLLPDRMLIPYVS